MEVKDLRGKPVNVGSQVRYSRTGTSGEVSAVKVAENQGWVKMNDSDLWYNTEYVEVFDKLESKTTRKAKADAQDDLSKAKRIRKNLEDVDMSAELCDGGG